MSEIKHSPGHFCWAELVTTDPGSASEFYARLLNWTARRDQMKGGGTYTTFFYEGLEAAACYELSPQMRSAGTPPHWMPYIMVEDVAAAAERVTAAGGALDCPPRQAGQYGHFALVRDPGGASFSLWQPASHFGSRNGSVLGRHCWTELATRDVPAAKDFYHLVFGWDTHTGDMGGMEYTTFLNNRAPVGGMYHMPHRMDGIPPHWMVYFSVADIQAAVAATHASGGVVLSDCMDVPGVGTMATIRDAQGAHVSFIQLKTA